ncbi:MAG: aspartate kinase [Planctomycetota bacterium]|nr:aspartate kinase [Planctomycetota bacterium]
MSLIVQKFGGTSVADCEKIRAAARKAIRAQQQGHQVVMVVSAMGKNTDTLVALAHELNDRPPAREMDMLLSTGEQVSVALMAMAIEALGHRAISLTGGQIGINTDSTHTKARIRSISTDRMRRYLAEGCIVIAAGFQGIDDDFNITTLGRGGSDTTAVALAAVLNADECEIYTDVDGVYTTDPRLLPEARRVSRISYDEMLELSSLGAGVMHSRSIEFAKKFSVPVHVRSSFTDTRGTLIIDQPEDPTAPVSGAALTRNEARVTVNGLPDVPGTSLAIFSRIARRNISVDMIVQNAGAAGKADISFTVPQNELHDTLEAVGEAREVLGPFQITHDASVAKLSVVGLGMARQTGVAEHMFQTLAAANINIQMITTSEIKISVLVDRENGQRALREVHRTFQLELERTPAEAAALPHLAADSHAESARALDVVQQLHGDNMEELLINDILLDATQGSITIHGLPDTPGIAATVFRSMANAKIFVDMIVQSHGSHHASLSFTVPREDVEKAKAAAAALANQFAWKDVTSRSAVAKLSVSGIGLRSHTDVAIRMFRALSETEINVEMISTSEVRVNVVVDAEKGALGLRQLQEVFFDITRT